MQRKGGVYACHETLRVAELEGVPLASFIARAIAFAIDMLLAIVSFMTLYLIVILVGIELGWINISGNVHFSFDPFHVGSSHEGSWKSIVFYVVFIALCNYVGNGATPGKRLMKIRAVVAGPRTFVSLALH